MNNPDDVPIDDYDQLTIGDLQHRARGLDRATLETVLTYEAAHAARVPVLQILEARLRELDPQG